MIMKFFLSFLPLALASDFTLINLGSYCSFDGQSSISFDYYPADTVIDPSTFMAQDCDYDQVTITSGDTVEVDGRTYRSYTISYDPTICSGITYIPGDITSHSSSTEFVFNTGMNMPGGGPFLTFKSHRTTAECVFNDHFTLEFNLGKIQKNMDTEDDDPSTPDSQSVTGGITFDMAAYHEEDRINLIGPDTLTSGHTSYVTISPSVPLADGYTFAPSACRLDEDECSEDGTCTNVDSFTLFDIARDQCVNAGPLGFTIKYDEETLNWEFKFMMFLFNPEVINNYLLKCDVDVCAANQDPTSICNTMAANCMADDQTFYTPCPEGEEWESDESACKSTGPVLDEDGCPPNSSHDDWYGICVCDVDYYESERGDWLICTPCPGVSTTLGATNAVGQSKCACPENTYAYNWSSDDCRPCPEGRYSNADTKWWAHQDQNAACTGCLDFETWKPQEGNSMGHCFVDPDNTDVCPEGAEYSSWYQTCVCSVDYYQSVKDTLTGEYVCSPCPGGSSTLGETNAVGQSTCACPENTYAYNWSSEDCRPCPEGRYSNANTKWWAHQDQDAACTGCFEFETWKPQDGNSMGHCFVDPDNTDVCPEGAEYAAYYGTCICSVDHYQSVKNTLTGEFVCAACPDGTSTEGAVNADGQGKCYCPSNTYAYNWQSNDCRPCPDGRYSNSGTSWWAHQDQALACVGCTDFEYWGNPGVESQVCDPDVGNCQCLTIQWST